LSMRVLSPQEAARIAAGDLMADRLRSGGA
jgi:hypothetical protein